MNRIKATRLPICYHNRHLHRPDIDILDMDDIRLSFSKLKKDIKHRVGGKKRVADRAGASVAEETAGSSASPTRPGSRVTASGRGEEGSRISTDVSQAHSRDRSPHPKSIQAVEGGGDSQGREADVDEKGVSRSLLRLGPDVGDAVGSGPGREIGRGSSPLFVSSVSPKLEPDSAWTLSPRQSCLITHLDNVATPAVPDRLQGDPRFDKNAAPSASTDEKKSSWKSTAFATAKLLLRGVRDSADAFGPLKSVAGGLCFILENCEVWPYPCLHSHDSDRSPANEGERANDRVVGTPSEGTCRITSFTRSR